MKLPKNELHVASSNQPTIVKTRNVCMRFSKSELTIHNSNTW